MRKQSTPGRPRRSPRVERAAPPADERIALGRFGQGKRAGLPGEHARIGGHAVGGGVDVETVTRALGEWWSTRCAQRSRASETALWRATAGREAVPVPSGLPNTTLGWCATAIRRAGRRWLGKPAAP